VVRYIFHPWCFDCLKYYRIHRRIVLLYKSFCELCWQMA
jgi:hypothetical protein